MIPVVCSLSSTTPQREITYGSPEVSVEHTISDCMIYDYTSTIGKMYKNISNAIIRIEKTGSNCGVSIFKDYNNNDDLADAVKLAECYTNIDTIFVAQGTYVPKYTFIDDSTDYSTKSFVFGRDSLAIIGGYSSSGSAHNFELYPTILIGDLGAINAYHVITVKNNPAKKIDTTLHFNGLIIKMVW